MYCHNCGKPIIAGAKFCQNCGVRVESTPEDLVAQKVEALDLSDDTTVDNDALIEKTAQWKGVETHNLALIKTESKPLAITTYRAKKLKIVIQCGSIKQKPIYWFEDNKGNLISDYYDWIKLEMSYGVFVAQKNGKYGHLIWRENKIESVTPFIFDQIQHYAHGILPDAWWRNVLDITFFVTFDDVRYNHKNCRLIWFRDGIQLFEKKTSPARTVMNWGDGFSIMGHILLWLAFIKGVWAFNSIGKFNFAQFIETFFSGGLWWLIIITITIIAGIIGARKKESEYDYLDILGEYEYDMDEHNNLNLPDYAEFK